MQPTPTHPPLYAPPKAIPATRPSTAGLIIVLVGGFFLLVFLFVAAAGVGGYLLVRARMEAQREEAQARAAEVQARMEAERRMIEGSFPADWDEPIWDENFEDHQQSMLEQQREMEAEMEAHMEEFRQHIDEMQSDFERHRFR